MYSAADISNNTICECLAGSANNIQAGGANNMQAIAIGFYIKMT